MSRKKRYGLPEQFNLYKGIVSRHPKGFGFLELEDSESEDIAPHPEIPELRPASPRLRLAPREEVESSRTEGRSPLRPDNLKPNPSSCKSGNLSEPQCPHP